MTVEQAFNVLEQARKRFTGTGADNDAFKEAIETIARELRTLRTPVEAPVLNVVED